MDFNAQTQSCLASMKGKKIKIAFVLGIVTAVIGFMPLIISWFIVLRPFVYIFGALTLVFAGMAVADKEDYQSQIAKFAAAAVLALLAIALPWIMKESYYTAKIKYANSLTEQADDAIEDFTDKEKEEFVKKVEKSTEKFQKAYLKAYEKSL